MLSKDPLYQNSFTASPLTSQNSPNFISDAPLSDITESSNSEGCEDDKELLEDLIDDPSTANRLASLAFFLLHDKFHFFRIVAIVLYIFFLQNTGQATEKIHFV